MIEITGLSVGFHSQVILAEISLDIPRQGIVCLLGPAGVGKSTLLRTLGRWNDALPSCWIEGTVRLAGNDYFKTISTEEGRRRMPLLHQKARLYTSTVLENAIASVRAETPLTLAQKHELAHGVLSDFGLWDLLGRRLNDSVSCLPLGHQRILTMARLISGGAECLMVDEPLRDLSKADAEAVYAFLQRLGQRSAVLLVTHNQIVARKLANRIALLVAGRLAETASTDAFFSRPRTSLAQDFIATGNCWPSNPSGEPLVSAHESELPPRPGGFHWVIPDLLAGMQKPGLLQNEEQDLRALERLGCRKMVSLTTAPFPLDKLAAIGIEGIHCPIPDMGVPSVTDAIAVCKKISGWLDEGLPTVLHCRAGLGRTGTMLAATLVFRGQSSVQAIEQVRAINPRYIQSAEQLALIGELAQEWAPRH